MSCLHFEHASLHDNLHDRLSRPVLGSGMNPRKDTDYGLSELSTDELLNLVRSEKNKRKNRLRNQSRKRYRDRHKSGEIAGNPEPKPAKKKLPTYRYGGIEIRQIWMKSEARPHLVRQLNPELRVVMGLWSHTGLLTKQKVALSGCLDSGEFLELNRKLLNDYEFTSLDAVRHCMAHGLPTSAAVALHGEIVCTKCGNRTWTLPCLRCWRGLDDDAGLEDEGHSDIGPLRECLATTAEPGSPEKIEVLRKRASRNQHLWHDDDPVVLHSMGMTFFSGE